VGFPDDYIVEKKVRLKIMSSPTHGPFPFTKVDVAVIIHR
jgi:hypothetical protein